jgi:HSP20 family protein
MPTIIRKPYTATMETRKDILHAIHWHVRSSVWRPPTDIYETDESFVVKVEIAGMREEDFIVAAENRLLRIEGIRPDAVGRRAYHQMEILSGKFEVEVDLLVAVDMESAVAEYRDGFLTITLPKAQPKPIRVDE